MLTGEQRNISNDSVKKPKALALLSGGLDSTLAVKIITGQAVDVEAVNFVTPFCLGNTTCSIERLEDLGVKVHRVFLGEEFLNLVVNPPHGHGSQMNPCIDCRILMLKKAKELAEKIGADFLVTGEVLDERPFSQRMQTLMLIEKKAGVEGRVLRPLSARLLPETEPEKRGIVKRESLLAIRGRRRLPQIELARKTGIKDYPNPSGGCLLTDPRFAQRLGEHLRYKKELTFEDVALLRVGRHFRLGTVKVIVGRNREENDRLLATAKGCGIPYLEANDYVGPVTLYIGEERKELIEKAAAITLRYSDAPKDAKGKVTYKDENGGTLEIITVSAKDEELEKLRI
ncbi:MAG: hypothetical protein QXG97_07240 [Nitrososphaerota archaeon]